MSDRVRLFGGAMVGLQTTSTKTALGPLLNGIVNYDFWLPVKAMQFPGVLDFLKKSPQFIIPIYQLTTQF